MEPKGRAGWLAFLIFVLIFSTIAVASTNLTPIFQAEGLGAVLPQGFKPVYFASVLIPAGILLFAAWVLIKQNDWYAVTITIRCMWIGALTSIAAPIMVLNSYFPDLNATKDAVGPTFSALIWLTVWTLYLLKSRRVRNTFAIGAPGLYATSPSNASSVQDIFTVQPQPRTPTHSSLDAASAHAIQTDEQKASSSALKFTIFRSNADEKWYWVLQDTASAATVARSSGKISRSDCLHDISVICAVSTDTPIWDKTSNEYA